MSALNFPDNPADVGNVYVGDNGITYDYINGKWRGRTAAGTGGGTADLGKFVIVNDPGLAILSTTGTGYDIVIAATQGEGVQYISIPNNENAALGNNLIIGTSTATSAVQIQSLGSNWTFGTDGTLTLPGNTDITVPASYDANRQGRDIRIQGQRGYGNWGTNNVSGFGGDGSSIQLTAGRGGESSDADQGGEGGAVNLYSGVGSAGGNGGTIRLTGGNAEFITGTNPVVGGNIQIQAGNATYSTNSLGVGGDVEIKSGVGTLASGNIYIKTYTDIDGYENQWQFRPSGELRNNNSFTKTTSGDITNGTASFVVWTASENYVSGAKLLIQVEANEIGDATGWHSQMCEAVIASRGYADTFSGPGGDPQMTVYGVTHTSTAPLVTFTVQRNPVTKKIEVVGTKTAAVDITYYVCLRIHSVETGTRD